MRPAPDALFLLFALEASLRSPDGRRVSHEAGAAITF
jgi:hypothetical protein